MSRQSTVAHVEQIAEQVAAPEGIEIVEVELKGSGRNQLLRVYIDKPEGVTHGDCEHISRLLGERLDSESTFPDQYTLEVSSPGVERKLKKPAHFQRFEGKKVRVVVRAEESEQRKNRLIEGTLAKTSESVIELDTANGEHLIIPFTSIDRANLKFEW